MNGHGKKRTENKQRATTIAVNKPSRRTGRVQTAIVPEPEPGPTAEDGSHVSIARIVSTEYSTLLDANEAEPITGKVDISKMKAVTCPQRELFPCFC